MDARPDFNVNASTVDTPLGIPANDLVKGTNNRLRKETKSKSASDSATRFQCSKCDKNFSRVENLTRHQANHEDVGKFVCVICRKRFTRSDLLNRHRRIHGPQGERDSRRSHVTRPEGDISSSISALPSIKNEHSASPDGGSSTYSNQSPQGTHLAGSRIQGVYPEQDVYQISLQEPGSSLQNALPQAQGLTSLMEAALAPQTAQFQSIESINPATWDGFMFGSAPASYMGTYDADMSWTLDYLSSEQSPSYLVDQEMFNVYDDFEYSYEGIKYAPDIEDAEGEDEDTNDWPDKVERPILPPPRMLSRIVPVRAPPTIIWETVRSESRTSGLTPSSFRPFQLFTQELRETMLMTLNESTFNSRPQITDSAFPPADILDFFLRLYIRYIHPRFPILHLPTFDIYNTSPLLLVAMMFLGSSHSHADRGMFSRCFHEHLRIAVSRMQEVEKKYLRNLDNILTYFLLCLAGTWSGSKASYEFAEGARGILITACRRARLLDCRATSQVEPEEFLQAGHNIVEAHWLAWAETEKRKRLGICIYIYDSQYPSLFNNQPYISKAETTNCIFPCHESFYTSPTSSTWSLMVGPSYTPPQQSYYLHALNCCLLRKWVQPAPPIAQINDFGKTVLIYALHTHVFEWRQATSMLNPTGLMGTFGNSAHDIGDGLRTRRRWLVDGLDSFIECYASPPSSSRSQSLSHTSTSPQNIQLNTAAKILHHLAHISLAVSLSDIHLLSGRSTNPRDADFAEQNLRQWANSELAKGTMTHVDQVLAVCHRVVERGEAADASFEVAMGLFTGGMVCWAFERLKLYTSNPTLPVSVSVEGTHDPHLNTGIGMNTTTTNTASPNKAGKSRRDPKEKARERERDMYIDHVRRAAKALNTMGTWGICGVFGRILESFENGIGPGPGHG